MIRNSLYFVVHTLFYILPREYFALLRCPFIIRMNIIW